MVTWFRGVVKAASDTADGIRIAQSIGRGVRELKDLRLMGQRGLVSVPLDGDRMLCLQADDLTVAVATESTDRPVAASGETILYASKNVFVRLNSDGSVRVQGSSSAYIEIAADGSMKAKAASMEVEAENYANILSPKIGLGKDARLGTPVENPVTTGCPCIFGVPHPAGATGVFIPVAPAP